MGTMQLGAKGKGPSHEHLRLVAYGLYHDWSPADGPTGYETANLRTAAATQAGDGQNLMCTFDALATHTLSAMDHAMDMYANSLYAAC